MFDYAIAQEMAKNAHGCYAKEINGFCLLLSWTRTPLRAAEVAIAPKTANDSYLAFFFLPSGLLDLIVHSWKLLTNLQSKLFCRLELRVHSFVVSTMKDFLTSKTFFAACDKHNHAKRETSVHTKDRYRSLTVMSINYQDRQIWSEWKIMQWLVQ